MTRLWVKQLLCGVVVACVVGRASTDLNAQQILIPRIEQMPNLPTPYVMRNWKRVTLNYDSLVFDLTKAGEYLPLAWVNSNAVNYPNHPSVGLYSYVGTNSLNASEAINVLPAVISATLLGVDKRNRSGYNWVLMCEEYFNKRPSENVYLNRPVAKSGNDWWYDTMPNVFFYQLYHFYPDVGDFKYQFSSIADRWLQAVRAMNGSATPWRQANMNYRAWSLSTMTPNSSDVPEPEAAGAIAWILYNAFVTTGDVKYRMGAEWAMEFLNNQTTNPAYELQLPYGAYTAARMNAELGTTYDAHKLVNWCFEVGPLRQWGAIVGKWGEDDCSGLIGEVNGSNDYAFAMNTFEQIGALVPLVRYDERFARAIGKWVLNAANAARLFYSDFLHDQNQDNRVWTRQYDPHSAIAYEALRQAYSGKSPYGTGDAMQGGWAKTNLALYGSSHVGTVGGIIDTTNVEGILKLDLLATDYYHTSAHPTFLFYNPHSVEKSVELTVGTAYHDIYDAVSNSFLATNVTGTTLLPIPANSAVLIVMTPAGGTITYNLEKMLVNGIVVDYHSGRPVQNYPPRLKGSAAAPTTILRGKTTTLYATATDRDSDPLIYSWNATHGTIVGAGQEVTWVASDSTGTYQISCIVADGRGGYDSALVRITVVDVIPSTPVITSLSARPTKIDLGGTSKLTCVAFDSSGSQLRYRWSSNSGSFSVGDSVVLWTAPRAEGNYSIKCTVENLQGGQTTDSVAVVVRDFSKSQTGSLVAYYSFNGNANDMSGNGHHATVKNAMLVADRQGNSNSAYYFNGGDAFMQVASQTDLNFQNAITVSFWMRIDAFYDREAYPISHGNWENRWKVSITDRKLRWTVKTTNGIKDLDSKAELAANTYYHIVVLYSGSDFEVYLNGELDAFSSWSGTILPTAIDLTIGQVLPTNAGYNFNGVLDELRIYDYALSVTEILRLYDVVTSVEQEEGNAPPAEFYLFQNYPNPFNPTTTIEFSVGTYGHTSLRVFDVLGREVAVLLDEQRAPGVYRLTWDARLRSANSGGRASSLPSGVYLCRMQAGNFIETRKLTLLR